tara:strand:- start:7867 stop:8322 length:456 start_codon:yes stop_codon:yes gene_type:complete
MDRYELIKEVKKYFKITELVDSEVYAIHGERAWKFFDYNLLKAILIIRKGLNLPITINTKTMQQRGLRHNLSAIVAKKERPYLSAHCLGKALDFNVKGMSSEDVRIWIKKNYFKFDFKIRLEHKLNGKPISWVHIDTINEEQNEKVYLFNV